MIFDWRHKTRFAESHKPTEMGASASPQSSGNFPAHPRFVRLLLAQSGLKKDAAIIDIGHGSGIVLFVAAQLGYTNISGIEYGSVPYAISVQNVGKKARLNHGDALSFDLSEFDAIFFFSPFRGDMAKRFFSSVPDNILMIITVNHDRCIESIILERGYEEIFSYNHPWYGNFNGKIWKRCGA